MKRRREIADNWDNELKDRMGLWDTGAALWYQRDSEAKVELSWNIVSLLDMLVSPTLNTDTCVRWLRSNLVLDNKYELSETNQYLRDVLEWLDDEASAFVMLVRCPMTDALVIIEHEMSVEQVFSEVISLACQEISEIQFGHLRTNRYCILQHLPGDESHQLPELRDSLLRLNCDQTLRRADDKRIAKMPTMQLASKYGKRLRRHQAFSERHVGRLERPILDIESNWSTDDHVIVYAETSEDCIVYAPTEITSLICTIGELTETARDFERYASLIQNQKFKVLFPLSRRYSDLPEIISDHVLRLAHRLDQYCTRFVILWHDMKNRQPGVLSKSCDPLEFTNEFRDYLLREHEDDLFR